MIVRPHADFESLARRVARLRPLAVPFRDTAFRSVRPKYWASDEFLQGEGSRRHGGRWNPPGSFRSVYLSTSIDTALAEIKGWLRYFGLPTESALPRVFAAVEVVLSLTLDLTEGAMRQRLLVSRERMVEEDWRRENEKDDEALTQAIGRAAFDAGFEGILVPSAQDETGRNVLVFSDKLLPDSRLEELGVME